MHIYNFRNLSWCDCQFRANIFIRDKMERLNKARGSKSRFVARGHLKMQRLRKPTAKDASKTLHKQTLEDITKQDFNTNPNATGFEQSHSTKQNTLQDSVFIFDGRRIVDMNYLIEKLKTGCTVCSTRLNLCCTLNEKRYGLGVMLDIKCKNSRFINKVPTGKSHFDSSQKITMPIFDINTKAAAGIIFIYHLIRTQGTILRNHTTKQKRKKEIQSIVKTKCYNTTSCTNVV